MSGPDATEPHAAPRERRYVDANGIVWRVRERVAADRGPALYFESAAVVRRVSHYPPDWRDLPTAELEILSLRT